LPFLHSFVLSFRGYQIWVMVFNTTCNNISAISWRSVLLMEEIGVLGENHRPATINWQTFITYCCIEYTRPERDSNSQRKFEF